MLRELGDFDGFMETLISDWNVPGIGVSIARDDEVVFSKGYGYRDHASKLPYTGATWFPIASNTKLFTAVAAGLLVDRGLLGFDRPIREFVPSLRFYDKALDEAVTLRDMLSHRTGVPRHDMIWYEARLSQAELFERIRFMKPTAPLRSKFIYNNMMYEAVGHIIELLSGKRWDHFVRDEILTPLGMTDTEFTVADMLTRPEPAVPFLEKRDSDELWQPPYMDTDESSPAGSIVATMDDMSRWLLMLMNNGRVAGKQVIPGRILKATLAPGVALPDAMNEVLGFTPELNGIYGMGRQTASYRGHLLASHGGDLRAFHSQVSYLPNEKIGVNVFVIGDHCAILRNAVGYEIYDRLLGLPPTDWTQRLFDFTRRARSSLQEARQRVVPNPVPNTCPSHDLAGYVGRYEHPAYGPLTISLENDQLQLAFRKISLPLNHFHYDRFDTPDDEVDGAWSVLFQTSSLGDIDRVVIWLDQADAVFKRVPDAVPQSVIDKITGTYVTAIGIKAVVRLNRGQKLTLRFPNGPAEVLVPFKDLQFRSYLSPDTTFEFVMDGDRVKALRHWDAIAEFVLTRSEDDDTIDTMEEDDPADE
ncbi:D-aminopeptidase [Paraburkholderia sediminicola]|uniref:D-aminopeptidase n=1 Tax=Paraburkholderia sediminicola TaxID=458836 RepID=A0A6J5AA96_9BURK|nr:serine hydrolase [Paraburkholderia sediminicola]CAB3650535.1 D-aminopeptidase [Paraburkholderia sediminicola]